jgi:hypothetical protein
LIYILKSFLIENDSNFDKIDTTLFTKRKGNGILIVQIYVDDIIFIITNLFMRNLQNTCKMSLKWAWLQTKQTRDDIFINQSKYNKDLLKRFMMAHVKKIETPMGTSTKLNMDGNGKNVDII